MMVEFLTLFLALVRGPQIVELSVVGPVAEVEVRFDGEELVTLTEPPWVFDLDLGDRLLPHDLVAIARDDRGRVLDRAEQWINVELSQAGARMALEADAQGRPEAVRVVWEGVGRTRLDGVELELDGRAVPVEDPERVPLPDHGLDEFHYLSGSVRIGGGDGDPDTERLDTGYGGSRTVEISTELTAVAVVLEDRRRLPAAGAMRSWFVKDGRPLKVHGVEKGDAEVVVVRAAGSQEVLDSLATSVYTSVISTRKGSELPGADWDPAEFFAGGPDAAAREGSFGLLTLSRFARLDFDVLVRWVSPRPGVLSPRGIEPEAFVRSRDLASNEADFLQLWRRAEPTEFAPKPAEAVALAGILANSGHRRRAVLLLLAGDGEGVGRDVSDYPASVARDYLRALRVPLVVWGFGSGISVRHEDWRERVDLGDPSEPRRTLRNVEAAVAELQRNLRKQRIVWLVGRHLPQKIELGPAARGIRLAGS